MVLAIENARSFSGFSGLGIADELRWFKSDRGSFQNEYARGRLYATLLTGNPQASGGFTTTNTPAAAGQ